MSVGVLLRDGWPMTFAKFVCFVADEKAIKEVWCNKGASGYRFCPFMLERMHPQSLNSETGWPSDWHLHRFVSICGPH